MIGWHLQLLRTKSVSKFMLLDHDGITHEIINIYFSIPYTTLRADQYRNLQKGETNMSRNAHDPRLMYSLYWGISVVQVFCPYTSATQGKRYYCLHVGHVTSIGLVYFVWWLGVCSYRREDAKRLAEAGGLFVWGPLPTFIYRVPAKLSTTLFIWILENDTILF
jgi:hypothetical protein